MFRPLTAAMTLAAAWPSLALSQGDGSVRVWETAFGMFASPMPPLSDAGALYRGWTRIMTGCHNDKTQTTELLRAPDPQTVVVVCRSGRVLLTQDGGSSWRLVFEPPAGTDPIVDLQVDPGASRVTAVFPGFTWTSPDGGRRWSRSEGGARTASGEGARPIEVGARCRGPGRWTASGSQSSGDLLAEFARFYREELGCRNRVWVAPIQLEGAGRGLSYALTEAGPARGAAAMGLRLLGGSRYLPGADGRVVATNQERAPAALNGMWLGQVTPEGAEPAEVLLDLSGPADNLRADLYFAPLDWIRVSTANARFDGNRLLIGIPGSAGGPWGAGARIDATLESPGVFSGGWYEAGAVSQLRLRRVPRMDGVPPPTPRAPFARLAPPRGLLPAPEGDVFVRGRGALARTDGEILTGFLLTDRADAIALMPGGSTFMVRGDTLAVTLGRGRYAPMMRLPAAGMSIVAGHGTRLLLFGPSGGELHSLYLLEGAGGSAGLTRLADFRERVVDVLDEPGALWILTERLLYRLAEGRLSPFFAEPTPLSATSLARSPSGSFLVTTQRGLLEIATGGRAGRWLDAEPWDDVAVSGGRVYLLNRSGRVRRIDSGS